MNRIIMTVAAACVATVMGTFDASAASGKRIAALDDAHWSSSVWISAAMHLLLPVELRVRMSELPMAQVGFSPR